MKKTVFTLVLLLALAFTYGCKKDEGKLPNIAFKTSSGYTYSSTTLAGGTHFTIGINASKAEDKDVLKQFNVSKSVNGGASSSVFTVALTDAQQDNYSYDLPLVADTTSGQATTYTFAVTNRDGLTNSVSLTVTVQ